MLIPVERLFFAPRSKIDHLSVCWWRSTKKKWRKSTHFRYRRANANKRTQTHIHKQVISTALRYELQTIHRTKCDERTERVGKITARIKTKCPSPPQILPSGVGWQICFQPCRCTARNRCQAENRNQILHFHGISSSRTPGSCRTVRSNRRYLTRKASWVFLVYWCATRWYVRYKQWRFERFAFLCFRWSRMVRRGWRGGGGSKLYHVLFAYELQTHTHRLVIPSDLENVVKVKKKRDDFIGENVSVFRAEARWGSVYAGGLVFETCWR